MSIRTYLFIAIAFLGIAVLIGLLNANGGLASFVLDVRVESIRAGLPIELVDLVTQPLLMVLNHPQGGLIAALLWPLIVLGVVLLMVMFLVGQVGVGLADMMAQI